MKTITFYSYKGGVGRTLLLANMARYLAVLNKKVFVMDFDLEAPGLHYKLGLHMDRGPLSIGPGLLDYIGDFAKHRTPPADLKTFVISVPVQQGQTISFLPAGNPLDDSYINSLFHTDWNKLFYAKYFIPESAEPVSLGVVISEVLKQSIDREYAPDYLLIDARTGVTEMGGAAATLFADTIIALSAPNRESMEGTRMMLRTFKRTRRLQGRPELTFVPVLSRVPFSSSSAMDEEASVKEFHDFLIEDSVDPSDTLCKIPAPIVLHSEPEIERKEQLALVELSSDRDLRLRVDYLQLIGQLVKFDYSNEYLQSRIRELQEQVWDNTGTAMRDFRRFVRLFPFPASLRAQLQLLDLAARTPKDYLEAVAAYGSWSGSVREEIQVEVVSRYFDSVNFLPDKQPKEWTEKERDLVEFISSLWDATVPPNLRIGLSLGEFFRRTGLRERALQVIEKIVYPADYNASLAIRWLQLLEYAQDTERAAEMVQLYESELSATESGFAAILRVAIIGGDRERCKALLRPDFELQRISLAKDLLTNGEMLRSLYEKADAVGEWQTILKKVLQNAQTKTDLYRLDALYKNSGLASELEAAHSDLKERDAIRELLRT